MDPSSPNNQTPTPETPQPSPENPASSPAPEPDPNLSSQIDQLLAAPVEKPTQPDQPAPTPKSRPNKKLIMILSLSIGGVLLLALAAFSIIYLSWRQSPEIIALDAISNLIKSEIVAVDGEVSLNYLGTDDFAGLKSLNITLSTSSQTIPYSATATVTVATSDDESISLTLSNIFMSNGVFYIRVDDLEKAFSDYLESASEDVSSYLELITDIVATIDGEWWHIDLGELEVGEETTGQYNCVIESFVEYGKSPSLHSEVAKFYSANPFINVEKVDGLYEVSINSANFVGFYNSVPDTTLYSNLNSCLENYLDFQELSVDDVSFDDLPLVKLDIDDWSHTLRSIHIDQSYEDVQYFTNLSFSYPNSIEVSAPENSRSVSELIDSVTSLIIDFQCLEYPDYYGCEETDPDKSANPSSSQSSRDTQRKDDLARLLVAIVNYQSDNRGSVPDDSPFTFSNSISEYLSSEPFEDPSTGLGYGYSFGISTSPTSLGVGAIGYYVGYTCSNDSSIISPSSGSRKIAITTKLESGTVTCLNN